MTGNGAVPKLQKEMRYYDDDDDDDDDSTGRPTTSMTDVKVTHVEELVLESHAT
jgi:hypothetical protein